MNIKDCHDVLLTKRKVETNTNVFYDNVHDQSYLGKISRKV